MGANIAKGVTCKRVLHPNAQGPDAVLIGSIVGGVAVVAGLILVTAWYFYRRRKGLSLLPTSHPGQNQGSARRVSTPIPISRSYPDIATHSDGKSSSVGSSPASKKGIFQITNRQWTLPTVPQRHQNFHRMLPHRLINNVEFTVQSVKQKEQPDLGGLKPELYKQASVDSLRSEHVPCGKLFFSLRYSQDEGALVVLINRAENLPAKDFSGTSDPYVKVYLLPDRKTKLQTKVHRKTMNPEFNETFTFPVKYDDMSSRVLQFNIFDFDRFSRHDVIGAVKVKDILGEGSLTNETYFVRDIYASQEKADVGEVMLSLCYLPTAGRLTLTVVKARNLKAMDITGYADPYIKVCLMCQGRRIKKRKTSVQRNTLNPVFNEALVFDVPQESVEDVYLIVKVVDYDRIGSDELMGCITLGPRISGQGREHWYEMLESPRKPVAQWYSLQEQVPFQSSANGKCCLRHRQSTEDSSISDNHFG